MLSYTTLTQNNTCKSVKNNNNYDIDTTVIMTLRGYGVVLLQCVVLVLQSQETLCDI